MTLQRIPSECALQNVKCWLDKLREGHGFKPAPHNLKYLFIIQIMGPSTREKEGREKEGKGRSIQEPELTLAGFWT